MNPKLSYQEVVAIREKKRKHSQLISEGRYAEARQCGPKVIAFEHGVDKATVYKLCANRLAFYPFYADMG